MLSQKIYNLILDPNGEYERVKKAKKAMLKPEVKAKPIRMYGKQHHNTTDLLRRVSIIHKNIS